MKLCVDCRHFLPTKYTNPDHAEAKCAKASFQNLVSGIIKYQYCEVMRLPGAQCGLNGLLYESKHWETLDV